MLSPKKYNEDETLPISDEARDDAKVSARKRNFITLPIFVCVSGVLMCAQLSLSIYTKSVLTSLETRFRFSSSLSGLIAGSSNFGNMVFVVLVSKLSSDGNRPRIMGIGSMVVALGGFINVVPHFVGSKYDPSLLENEFRDDASNYSSYGMSTTVSNSEISCSSSSNLYVLLIIGEMLQGIGATVLMPLCFSYVDDFAESGKSPLYIGIMFLLQNLGPGVGYVVGSFTSSLYVDFDRVDADDIQVQPNQDEWVGAWWLGYIIIGLCVIISAMPLFWFPRVMHKTPAAGKKKIRESKPDKDHQDSRNDDYIPLSGTLKAKEVEIIKKPVKKERRNKCTWALDALKDLLCTMKRLLTNPVYVLVVFGYSSLMFITGVLTTFMPKFIEIVFHQTKSKANLIFGLSIPFVICVGLFSGGFIVQRSKLQAKGTLLFIVCICAATVLVSVPVYFISCDYNMNSTCSGVENESICSELRSEICNSSCYGFVAMVSLTALFICHIVTPSYSVILRTVNPKDKCTALGLKFLIIRLVAFIPAPMITGSVIDNTCDKWSSPGSCGGTATCLEHDTQSFRYSYLHIVFIGIVCTFVFNLTACLVQRRKKEKPSPLSRNVSSV